MNAIMSDSIVLWRMCVIWERARFACAFAAALLFAALSVSIANIVLLVRALGTYNVSNASNTRDGDSEIISAHSQHDAGLVTTLFVLTLASNLSATMLVALKAWLNRRQLTRVFRSETPHTLVQRVLELLVESGVVYTALWLLYCIRIAEFNTQGTAVSWIVSHLDAAMAQITSIYPLTVFILVALDKIHHSRGPRTLRTDDLPREMNHTVTVTLEIYVESSTPQRPLFAHPAATLQHADNDLFGENEAKSPRVAGCRTKKTG
ncbi:hypothetical protein PENSPDRAFT_41925 [Peniophora sp. CONT]|nr:hypothetical protein PENSPDRAFT_41925 [Peniophora sp. CONT]